MTAKLYVCQSHSCKDFGSKPLLPDLEELCAGVCEVVGSSCLDHCARGPNVEVHYRGAKSNRAQKVVEGIRTFRKVEDLLKSEAGFKLSSLQRQVGQLKYDARRAELPSRRLAILQKALGALGGENKGCIKEPVLTSQLLTMRSRECGDPAMALRDAEQASALCPESAPANLALALALESAGRYDDALKALDAADIGTGSVDMKEMRQIEDRIMIQCKPVEDQKIAPVQPSNSAAQIADKSRESEKVVHKGESIPQREAVKTEALASKQPANEVPKNAPAEKMPKAKAKAKVKAKKKQQAIVRAPDQAEKKSTANIPCEPPSNVLAEKPNETLSAFPVGQAQQVLARDVCDDSALDSPKIQLAEDAMPASLVESGDKPVQSKDLLSSSEAGMTSQVEGTHHTEPEVILDRPTQTPTPITPDEEYCSNADFTARQESESLTCVNASMMMMINASAQKSTATSFSRFALCWCRPESHAEDDDQAEAPVLYNSG